MRKKKNNMKRESLWVGGEKRSLELGFLIGVEKEKRPGGRTDWEPGTAK